ncbi:unnamed protein product, partial [Rotaria sp. Silwood1]
MFLWCLLRASIASVTKLFYIVKLFNLIASLFFRLGCAKAGHYQRPNNNNNRIIPSQGQQASAQTQLASKQHINMDVLNSLISLITFFVKIESKNSPLLLKQLFVHIFFNPDIWIYCSSDTCFVQMRLYRYLATEFVTYSEIYHLIQSISEIIQTLYTLKYFYRIIDPTHRS